MSKKLYVFLLLLSILTKPALSADNTSTDYWFGFFTKQAISDGLHMWTETQLRYDLDITRMQQTLIRTGLLKQVGDAEIGLLYGFIEAGENKEHRLALQHSMQYGELSSLVWSHRIRLEFRPREDAATLAERFRYLIRGQRELSSTYHAVVWNEAFINLRAGTGAGPRLVERNRLFLGIRKQIAKSFNFEFGYLNQYVPRQNDSSMEHTLVTYFFF